MLLCRYALVVIFAIGPATVKHTVLAASVAVAQLMYHLQSLPQAMYGRSSEFFGDIQHHTSVECSLRQLLELASQQQQQQQGLAASADAAGQAGASTPAGEGAAAGAGTDTCCPNLYLAQQSLQEPGRRCDCMKHCMPRKRVGSINLHKQLMSLRCLQTREQSPHRGRLLVWLRYAFHLTASAASLLLLLLPAGLSRLLADVPVPELMRDKQLTSVNMWFSSR
jgi:hypothetical protein